MEEEIVLETVGKYQDKIVDNKKSSLEEFLLNFTKDELLHVITIFNYNSNKVAKNIELDYFEIKNTTKKKLIDLFMKHYYSIYHTIIQPINEDFLESLESLITDYNGVYSEEFTGDYFYFSLCFLEFIRENCLGLIHYDLRTKMIQVLIPEQICRYIKNS